MIRNLSWTEKRSAFTLIELMIVLLIIAVLVSLLVSAVSKVMGKIPETQTRVEITEMDAALAAFMADYNLSNPPPSSLLIKENGQYNPLSSSADAATVKFFQQWFGRSFVAIYNPGTKQGTYDWNGDGNINEAYLLTGQQCLVFYLGGIPLYSAPGVVSGMSGFSPNAANPAAPAAPGSRRYGPYFNFIPSRLRPFGTYILANGTPTPQPLPFPEYLDPWQFKGGPQAYAFFSSQGKVNGYQASDCGGYGYPYYEMTAAGGKNFAYNNRYQIISAGKDGMFTSGGNGLWSATSGPLMTVNGPSDQFGMDNQANFSTTLLGLGQH